MTKIHWLSTEFIAWSMVLVLAGILASQTLKTATEVRRDLQMYELAAPGLEESNAVHEFWEKRNRDIRKEIEAKDARIAELEAKLEKCGCH